MIDRERAFEHSVFLELYHKLAREFTLIRRTRAQTFLQGTGCVYDGETGSRFFQVEQRWPFDKNELRKGYEKLVKKLVGECFDEIKEKIRSYDVKEGDRVLILAASNLPPVWLTEPGPGDELYGCVQVNVRWVLCLPDHLPLGLEGPRLIVPAKTGGVLE
jgi:hypothetical protein